MFALSLALCLAQSPPSWGMAQNGSFVFGSDPWVPVGVRVPADKGAIDAALKAGIKDLLIEVPERGWEEAVEFADQQGARYGLVMSATVPPATGYLIQPEAYRYGPYRGKTTLSASLREADHAWIVPAIQRDATLQNPKNPIQRVQVNAGRVSVDLDPQGVDTVALVVPHLQTIKLPDLGEGFDQRRDQWLVSLTKLKSRQGLRFIVDPLGQLPNFPGTELRFIPTDDRFQQIFEVHLRKKYGSALRVAQAWGMGATDQTTIKDLTGFVPLWSEKRGVAYAFDRKQGNATKVDRSRSQIWTDYNEVIQITLRQKVKAMSEMISREAGVPVIQSWTGWQGAYGQDSAGNHALAVQLFGTSPSEILERVSRAAYTVRQTPGAFTMICSEWPVQAPIADVGAVDKAMEDTASLGIRGWFFRSSDFEFVKEMGRRWSSERVAGLARPSMFVMPDAALGNAVTMRITGNTWWVPGNVSGALYDISTELKGYRCDAPEGSYFALWRPMGLAKVRLRHPSPKTLELSYVDGSLPKVGLGKTHVDVEIGNIPLIIRGTDALPVAESALIETISEYDAYVRLIPGKSRELIEEVAAFKAAQDNVLRDPSTSFLRMRAQLARLRSFLSPALWIDGEASRNHNWGEITEDASAGTGFALSLYARLTPFGGVFRTEYNVTPKLEGDHRVWTAIKGDNLGDLELIINGQTLRPELPGIIPYGTGYRWVSWGTVNLPVRTINVALQAGPDFRGDVHLDSIMLAPDQIMPTGAGFPLLKRAN